MNNQPSPPSRFTHYLQDALLLFYDAWLRPRRLHKQLNVWVPSTIDKIETQWWHVFLFPTIDGALYVYSLCLFWWMLGCIAIISTPVLLTMTLGIPFKFPSTMFIVIAFLILVSWGTAIVSPALGLTLPMVIGILWSLAFSWTVATESAPIDLLYLLAWDISRILPNLLLRLQEPHNQLILRNWLNELVHNVFSPIIQQLLTLRLDSRDGSNLSFTGFLVAAIAISIEVLMSLPDYLSLGILLLIPLALGSKRDWRIVLAVTFILSLLWWGYQKPLNIIATLVLCPLMYYRIPFMLGSWLLGHIYYRRAKYEYQGNHASSLVNLYSYRLPPFVDESVWARVPNMSEILMLDARKNLDATLKLIEELAFFRYQSWVIPHAYTEITADTLAHYASPRQISSVKQNITWLPEDMDVFPQDIRYTWPRLCNIAQDVVVALDSDSIYNRRLGFSHAQEDLNALRQQLPAIGKVALQHWQPVVDCWVQILGRELEQPQLTADATLINPYDAGNPLTARRADLFRGRADLTERVTGALSERNRPTLVLHGSRRMGKTSFLLQLPRLLPGRTVPVLVDLQSPSATNSTARFFFTIARAIANDALSHSRLTLLPPPRDKFEHDPFGAFADWLDDDAIPTLKQAGDFNVLLCFDEFEKLGQALEAGRIEERVLDELRHTIQHRQPISVLFAGVQTLEDLGPRWSSYFISVRPLRIDYLSTKEAADLIRNPDPTSGFNLEYTDAAVSDILTATRCHPYLVQLVCSTLVDLANRDHALLATQDMVAEALTLSLERGEPYFRNLWDETSGTTPTTRSAGRSILRQIATTSGEIQDTPEVARAVERLLRYDVLERIEGNLRFQVPLIERWMRERAPTYL